jgi:hypothetical protein
MKYPKLTILLLASFAWVDDVMDMNDEYYV